MKFKITLIIALALLCSATGAQAGGGQKLSKQEKKALVAQQVKQAIDSRTLSIDVTRRLGGGFDSGSNAQGYSVAVRNDSVISDLPHYAVSTEPAMGGDYQESLHFSQKLDGWEIQPKKKNKNIVLFQATDHGREYIYQAEIYDNGKTVLNVFCNRASTVSFQGQLRLPKVE